jgi:hypothetical protein
MKCGRSWEGRLRGTKFLKKGDATVDINPGKDDKLLEWYYSSGIVGVFDRDRLTRITLNTYTDYQGFLVYTDGCAAGAARRAVDDAARRAELRDLRCAGSALALIASRRCWSSVVSDARASSAFLA